MAFFALNKICYIRQKSKDETTSILGHLPFFHTRIYLRTIDAQF
jgi:hypothetical protein